VSTAGGAEQPPGSSKPKASATFNKYGSDRRIEFPSVEVGRRRFFTLSAAEQPSGKSLKLSAAGFAGKSSRVIIDICILQGHACAAAKAITKSQTAPRLRA